MLIDGKKIAQDIRNKIKSEVEHLARKPCLAVILVGSHPASEIYVGRKTAACHEAGILSKKINYPSSISEIELLQAIEQLNQDPDVDGILVQLPLPAHISPSKVMLTVDPTKDVDGFHPLNVGRLLIGEKDGFAPCTPLGIQKIFEHLDLQTSGKHVVILGRSNIVGKPLAALLMQNTPYGNATVTVANSRTQNLSLLTTSADILIAALGQPEFVKGDMVKPGVIVIDVGINPVPGTKNKIVGDVDFKEVEPKASYITPVPGGVGPMTIAMLLHNTLKAHSLHP